MATKFTFKNFEKETGLSRVTATQGFYIKLNGNQIGTVSKSYLDSYFKVRLTVEDSTTKCGFKHITLVIKFYTLEEAKDWLKKDNIFKAIINKYNLFELKD